MLKRKGNHTRNETRKHTQSASGAAPGTNTLISLDLAVVIDARRDSLLKYNWQPAVLSTEIVGAEPCKRQIGKKLRSHYEFIYKELTPFSIKIYFLCLIRMKPGIITSLDFNMTS
jgi:hypothetical protein